MLESICTVSGNHGKGLSLRFNVVDYMAHHEGAAVFKIDHVDGGSLPLFWILRQA